MPVYILKHPSPDYRGFVHGVDFYHGIGSTSSDSDKDFLVTKLSCEVTETRGAGVVQSAPASNLPADAAFYGTAGLAFVAAAEASAPPAAPVKPGPKPKAKG